MTALGTPAGRRLVARQRAASERLRRDLAAADGTLRHPYFRDLRRDTGRPAVATTLDRVLAACDDADVVYLGDFHAVGA